ncbi:unnamed protein product [Prunus armeniaca]|uniref:Uncharacterized protein n=1 Tax=Prunus armeniaca TaxID=36596 RepID=A0A6J5TI47_PRUAR|nr:unnamed protein product [Prunus armeniaca]
MAFYQGFITKREEKVFYHIRHPYPVLYDHDYPAEEVSYFPAPPKRDEYHGGWPTKTVTVRPLPPQQVQYYSYPNTDQNRVHVHPPHHQNRRPAKTVEVPAQKPRQIKDDGVLTSTEVAEMYGGVIITESGTNINTKIYPRPNYP